MSDVIAFVSQDRIDAAWSDYAEQARKLRSNPSLLADRAFNERLTRLHERWRRLFLAAEER